MKLYERVKLFTGGDTDALEEDYNQWVHSMYDARESHAAIRHMPFEIVERNMSIRNYKGAETFCLAVFYKDFQLDDHEQGSFDRAAGIVNGVSMIAKKNK